MSHKTAPKAQIAALLFLRIVIGWHLLYEGLVKIFSEGWTSKAYLLTSGWIFSGIFKGIAGSQGLLAIVDIINISVLTLAGLALILGIYTRTAALAGAVLLALYYLAHPPFAATAANLAAEGNYLIVDKNLIEFFALIVLAAFPATVFPGLDRLRAFLRSGRPYTHMHTEKLKVSDSPASTNNFSTSRREVLKNLITLPILGGFTWAFLKKSGWLSHEESNLMKTDTTTGASKVFTFSGLEDLKTMLPKGKINGIDVSRIILGGNLLGGVAHSRDLIYVSPLIQKYFTDEKIMQTWFMAEQCGINTMSAWPSGRAFRLLKEYRRRGGKIQWLGHVDFNTPKQAIEKLQVCVDNGAVGIYIAGDTCDRLVFKQRVDEIGDAIQYIKKNNMFSGVACHALQVPVSCEKNGLDVDFYMKTLHHDNYWSATPEENRTVNIRFGDPDFDGSNHTSGHYHDNIWCIDAHDTVAWMRDMKKPWVAFKVLAAGAIKPAEGFKYAFDNGADFIHVGMFDFQIVDNVNTCTDLLASQTMRSRSWYA